MARKRKKPKFEDLTWDDLENWAGSKIVSRGRSYQRNGHVKDLSQTSTGDLIAWVAGSHTYATKVTVRGGELDSDCSCPYWDNCKHAVAVILEYLDYAKNGKPVPKIPEDDERIELLDEFGDENGWDEDDNESVAVEESFRPFLQKLKKSELLALIEELAEQFHEVRRFLHDKHQISSGDVTNMIKAVRKEIHELSAEPGWRNSWGHEGFIPDYSRVVERLRTLLDQGHANEVLYLGEELFEVGTRQVEMSHDEGETAMEIASCMEVVFEALPKSSLSPVEQMRWAIKRELDDQFELCGEIESFWKRKQEKSDWDSLADQLLGELKKSGKRSSDFHTNYRRDRLTDWIIEALRKAGRTKEIIPLCKEEAEITGSYVRLINELRKARRPDEAEEWIRKGIEATGKKWPGISSQLRNIFKDIQINKKNWRMVAAVCAEEFFQDPSLTVYKELAKIAKKSKIWPEVRKGVFAYLETGKLPDKKSSWPLPESGLPDMGGHRRNVFPDTETLIGISMHEKRPDDVLYWYKQREDKRTGWGWFGYKDDRIAASIKDKHPDEAIKIWKKMAANEIAQTKPNAYRQAAVYLRNIQTLLKKASRDKEWEEYLTGIRRENARKRKLVEILDRLDGRRIIERA
ncbi:MAG: SWIM zinc finger family protein [Pseudomonadota bacterium]